jgi:RNA polymerase sigma-70 factor (ECF subfamily)
MGKNVYQDLSDELLVKKHLRGDNESLGILYSRYYPKVYYKCLSFTRNQDDAFDMAQDVLVKTFCNIRSFRGTSKFSTWLFSITQNHCISQVSKRQDMCGLDDIRPEHFMTEDMDDEAYEERYLREDLEDRMYEYLDRLPYSDKHLLELKYRHGYSVKDLQKEFNLSMSAVKMRLLRARQKIENMILHGKAA